MEKSEGIDRKFASSLPLSLLKYPLLPIFFFFSVYFFITFLYFPLKVCDTPCLNILAVGGARLL